MPGCGEPHSVSLKLFESTSASLLPRSLEARFFPQGPSTYTLTLSSRSGDIEMALTLRLAGASHIPGAASRGALFGISRAVVSRQFASQRRRPYSTGAPEVQLTAPNGRTWSQPTGLFINNEFVPSTGGQMITTVNPT